VRTIVDIAENRLASSRDYEPENPSELAPGEGARSRIGDVVEGAKHGSWRRARTLAHPSQPPIRQIMRQAVGGIGTTDNRD